MLGGFISTCFGPSLGRSFVVALGVGSWERLGGVGCWVVCVVVLGDVGLLAVVGWSKFAN